MTVDDVPFSQQRSIGRGHPRISFRFYRAIGSLRRAILYFILRLLM